MGKSSKSDQAFFDKQQARARQTSSRNAAATAGNDRDYRQHTAAADAAARDEARIDRHGRSNGWW